MGLENDNVQDVLQRSPDYDEYRPRTATTKNRIGSAEVDMRSPLQIDSDAYDTDLDIEDDMPKSYTSMTPKDIYLRSCEQLGVVPASYFLANMKKPSLNMSHHGLGPKGAKAISPPLVKEVHKLPLSERNAVNLLMVEAKMYLKANHIEWSIVTNSQHDRHIVNTSIIDLDISDNWISTDGAKDIAEMLLENCYIARINLSQNKLGSKGAEYMRDMLMENSSLKSVNLSANDFKDSDAMYFADTFRSNFKLKEFDLSKNSFCEIGGEWLGQGIAANESIEYLNLSWNHLRLKGALAVAAGMKINITIKKLDLSWNGFADEGAAAMAEALKSNNTLTWLDLSHNRITGEGAKLLAKALLVNDTLRRLKIGDNPIDPENACTLLRAIAENERSSMEDLDLTGINVNEDFKSLARKLSQRSRASTSRTSFRYNVNRTEDMRTDFDAGGQDTDPMDVIHDFLEKKRLRLIDLFRSFDKDLSWRITPLEFKKGVMNAGIRLSKHQLRQLLASLDIDVDGQVNYKEFSSGRKAVLLRRREEKRRKELDDKLKRAEKERFLDDWKEAMRKTHTPAPSPRGSPSYSPHSSRPSTGKVSPRIERGLHLNIDPTNHPLRETVTPDFTDPKNRNFPVGRDNDMETLTVSIPCRPTSRPREKGSLESARRQPAHNKTMPVKYKTKPAAMLK